MTNKTRAQLKQLATFALLSMLLSACGEQKTDGSAQDLKNTAQEQVVATAEQAVEQVEQEIVEKATMSVEKLAKLGKRSYIRCRACHTLNAGGANLVGPNLHGLFGAKTGVKEGFAYSPALANAAITWDDESLRAWLKSPASFIPGNKMAFAGVSDEQELDALMAYLKENTK